MLLATAPHFRAEHWGLGAAALLALYIALLTGFVWNTPNAPPSAIVGEAPTDTELSMSAQKARRDQGVFRDNLLAAYERKCCITGHGPEAVLEAAHIEHSKSGLNSMENVLLLRSDLHALFDKGLLRIDPERMAVVLDDQLLGTPYWELHGRVLRRPATGPGPSRKLLQDRWNRTP
jgi:hypothetical protein